MVQLLYKTLPLSSINQNNVSTHILLSFINNNKNNASKYPYSQASYSWDESYHQVAHIPETVASRVRSQTLGGGPQSKCPPSLHWNQPRCGIHSSKATNQVAAPSRNASMPCHLVPYSGTGMLRSPTSVGRILITIIIGSMKPTHRQCDIWIA